MECNTIEYDYSTQRERYIFLASDLHIGNKRFDERLFKDQFDEAVDMGADILINGDVFDAVIPSDKKRYAPSGDSFGVDDYVGVALEKAYDLLKPYAKNIKVVGVGNHEASMVKYNGSDMVHMLLGYFRRDGIIMNHAGYTGFIRIVLRHKDSSMRALNIYYNHGQGGSAEVSKGMIDLQRRNNIAAGVIWLGHKHTKIVTTMDPLVGVARNGVITIMPRLGIITGPYLTTLKEGYDIDKTGFQLDYQEERMRTPSARGGVMLKLSVRGRGNELRVQAITEA